MNDLLWVGEPAIAGEVRACWANEVRSFHMPGHKGGQGAHELAAELIGHAALRVDLSELSGFDYLHSASGAVARAQCHAARLFGARQSFFLVNGATAGNQAAVLATVGDGERILMFRHSHRSVYAGVALAGAIPVYIDALHDAELDLAATGDPAMARAALQRNPGIRAIHVTRPNYYGFCCELAPYVALAREYAIPLIVDEAHGTHFAFHEAFPQSALVAGADIVIQSPHKTLSSLTQSSLLHVNGERIDVLRIAQTLSMLQSSSPSTLLLLSLDIALAQMAQNGRPLWGAAIELAQDARRRINTGGKLNCYGRELGGRAGIAALDATKLVVDVSALGMSGFAARVWLKQHCKINAEFADLRRIVCSMTIGDDSRSADILVEALSELRDAYDMPGVPIPRKPVGVYPPPRAAMSPRQAGGRRSMAVARGEALGHVAAEFVIPYPPGIPLLVPGEVIDSDVLRVMETLSAAGCNMVGPADANISTLRVLAGPQ
jgi:arginine/lysine/ornithine decarboxylase